MRKTTISMLISVFGASAIASSFPILSHASEEPVPVVYNLDVRIEGIDECLYCESVEIWTDETFTVADALSYVDSNEDAITITGIADGYITDVNGDAAGAFGGWDGWLYNVNGAEVSVGITDYQLSDGDSILLYFGDPYGVGMQFPAASFDSESGELTFTSTDVSYDADWNPVYTENPVVGMTVMWDGAEYITDENGVAAIDDKYLAPGTHDVSWEKVNEAGIPLVLRSEPGYTVEADYLFGDVSSDRVVDAVDASFMLREYVNSSTGGTTEFTEEQFAAGDINYDNAVDAADASAVLRYYANTSVGTFDGSFREFMNPAE